MAASAASIALAVLRYYAHTVKPAGAVERADRATSLADARTALCVAAGVGVDDIDPATGHDISTRAYEQSRASWVSVIEHHGWNGGYCRPESELPDVFAAWKRRRPDLTAGDSANAWLKDGQTAHLARWPVPDSVCIRAGCELHTTA